MSRQIAVTNARMAAGQVIVGDEQDLGIWDDEDSVVELVLPVFKSDTFSKGKPRRLLRSGKETGFSCCASHTFPSRLEAREKEAGVRREVG